MNARRVFEAMGFDLGDFDGTLELDPNTLLRALDQATIPDPIVDEEHHNPGHAHLIIFGLPSEYFELKFAELRVIAIEANQLGATVRIV